MFWKKMWTKLNHCQQQHYHIVNSFCHSSVSALYCIVSPVDGLDCCMDGVTRRAAAADADGVTYFPSLMSREHGIQ